MTKREIEREDGLTGTETWKEEVYELVYMCACTCVRVKQMLSMRQFVKRDETVKTIRSRTSVIMEIANRERHTLLVESITLV